MHKKNLERPSSSPEHQQPSTLFGHCPALVPSLNMRGETILHCQVNESNHGRSSRGDTASRPFSRISTYCQPNRPLIHKWPLVTE